MSKRRRSVWDKDPLKFIRETDNAPEEQPEVYDDEDGVYEQTTQCLEEAHEALSKLFNKSSKRGKQLRGLRRNDAWQ